MTPANFRGDYPVAYADGIRTVQGTSGLTDTVDAATNTAATGFTFSTGVLTGGAGDNVNDIVYKGFDAFSGATGYANTVVADTSVAEAITLANSANGTNTLTFSGGGADTVGNSSTDGTTTATVSSSSGSVTVTDSGTHSNAYTLSGAASLTLNTTATTGSDTITVGSGGGTLSYANTGTGRTGATVTFNRAIAGTDTVAMGTSTAAVLVLNVAQSTANAAQGMSAVDTLTLGASGGAYTITTASGDLSSTATIRNASAVVLGDVTLNTAATSAGVTVNLTNGSAAYASTGVFTLNGGYVNSVISGTGSDTVTVAALDGTQVTGTALLSTTLSTGTNTVTATVTGALAADELAITGSTGIDTLTLYRATNVAIIADAGDIVGQNQVNVTGTSTSGFAWTTGSGDLTENATIAIASTITGTIAVNLATGTTGDIIGTFYDVYGASNKFATGTGDDIVNVYQSDADAITTGDTLSGGTGVDELHIDLNNYALNVDFSGSSNVSGFESITLVNTGATNNDALVLTVKNTALVQGAGLVTIDASALQGTVNISNVAGTTAQTITGNTGADATVVGGTGADTLNFANSTASDITGGVGADLVYAGTGTATVNAEGGDSGVNASSGSYIGTSAFDVYHNVTAGDVLVLTQDASTGTGAWTAASSPSSIAGVADTIAFTRGTYDAATNPFTASATGTDSLVTWDIDGGGADTFNSFVLVGFVGTGTDSYASDVHTFTLT